MKGTTCGRGPGRPRVLTEPEIVDAALRVAREHGMARLSMRAVARELGVPPMTVYGYVANKDALNSLLIDRILHEVRVAGPDEGTWDQRLSQLLCDARRALAERPQLAEGRAQLGLGALHLLHRGAYGREASRLAAGVMDLLAQGGFGPDDIHTCFVVLFTYVTGHGESADLTDAISDDPLKGAPGRRSNEAIFALGLEALIEGLRATLLREQRKVNHAEMRTD